MRPKVKCAIIGWLATCCIFNTILVSISSASAATCAAIIEIVMQHEKAALEAFKTHDKKSFARLCRADFYEITSGGAVNTLQDELKELDDYVLGEYRMTNIVVTVLSNTAALIRYRVSAQYSYKGK